MQNKYSIIHACDFDTIIPAFLFSKIRRVPLFYTIYDYYSANIPDNLKIFKKFISTLEDYFISSADCVFVVDQNRLEQIKRCKINDVAVINNSPLDVPLVNLTADHDFTIFYAGALSKSRGIEMLLELAKRMPDVQLSIAGSGTEESKVKDAMKKCNNIQFLGQIPYQKVIACSLQADVLIALYDPRIENHKFASPNKLFEAMMLSKPIITSDNKSLENYICDEKCGITVRYGYIDNLLGAVLQLKQSHELCQNLGQNGRNAYERKYSWDIMKDRLLLKYDSHLLLS